MKTVTLLTAITACLMALVQVYFLFCSIVDFIDGDGLFANVIINLIFTLGYGMLSAFFFLLYKKTEVI